METSTTITPAPKKRRTLSSAEYTKDIFFTTSPRRLYNEKLKLSLEKENVHNQIAKISNRINKILKDEKKALKKSMIESQINEENIRKKERNAVKRKEMENIRKERCQYNLDFKEKVQQDRIRRKSHIKELVVDIINEKQEIVKKTKKTEIEWREIAKNQKIEINEENYKKANLVKEVLRENAQKRCVSQITAREKNKLDYSQKVNQIKNDKDLALKSLKEIEDKYDNVIRPIFNPPLPKSFVRGKDKK
ncbi:hypothetical protein SteCoe_30613 [Stentor coeruleus]|uniref:Uncharacterized protein n=1 Tax=Stentor coeruleus TaxID=5963 RepID=A0A1R2B3A4_9CILI|nr:hypothetical protein SteCoe_30613 [Stentor coeruleus]